MTWRALLFYLFSYFSFAQPYRDSNLVGLGENLGMGVGQTPPGDLSVKPAVKTRGLEQR